MALIDYSTLISQQDPLAYLTKYYQDNPLGSLQTEYVKGEYGEDIPVYSFGPSQWAMDIGDGRYLTGLTTADSLGGGAEQGFKAVVNDKGEFIGGPEYWQSEPDTAWESFLKKGGGVAIPALLGAGSMLGLGGATATPYEIFGPEAAIAGSTVGMGTDVAANIAALAPSAAPFANPASQGIMRQLLSKVTPAATATATAPDASSLIPGISNQLLGTGIGGLLGFLSNKDAPDSETKLQQNKLDPRMDSWVFGDKGLLGMIQAELAKGPNAGTQAAWNIANNYLTGTGASGSAGAPGLLSTYTPWNR